MTEEPRRSTSRDLFVESFGSFGIAFVVVLAFAILSIWIGLVAELLYALVALTFFIVPQKVMERRDLAPEDYGMSMIRPVRNIALGLLATAVTIPLFMAGYWVWEVQIRERSYAFDLDRYRQFSVEMQGEPDSWGNDKHGVWVWAEDHELHIGVRNDDVAPNVVLIRTSEPTKPTVRGVVLTPKNDEGTLWRLALASSRGRGEATFESVSGVEIEVSPVVEGRETWPLYTGPSAELADESRLDFDRDYWWLVLWLATQILLIALPEEYFYRGYLQTRLGEAFEKRREEAGGGAGWSFLGINSEVVVTSFLFGIGHLLIPVGGVLLANRFAVFFPSLLFGALRRKTDSITAPVVYHAMCNMMVLLAAVHFD